MLAVCLAVQGEAAAHGLQMSQLHLQVSARHIEGEWEILLSDARLAIALEPALQGDAGFHDLRAHEAALRGYLAQKLALASDGAACPVELTATPMAWDSAANQVRLHLVSNCPREPTRLTMHCDLLFDVDPKHRAYFAVDDARVTSVGVFDTKRRSVTVDVQQFHVLAGIAEFVREGALHIWSGLDHLMFLLALLLPAPLLRKGATFVPRVGLRATLRETVKLVTAFTVSHSLTLALAFFGLLILPARWVEAAIALSVFAAAWNNLRPFLPGRGWTMALAFGLVHGLGFAGALRNLSLPTRSRGLALGAFNVGVELGQLAIVAAILPLLFSASRHSWYPRAMALGSLAIAWLAALWLVQRGFGIALLPLP